jgi:hypothetical protein
MAWYPGAIRKPVTRHRMPMARHRGVCNHVAVSEAASLFNYFKQPGNPTSHFYVRRDGKVEQYVDTRFRAPANLEGNPSLISIETQGGVRDVDTEPWTDAQLETMARIWAWAHKEHGIPLQAMPDSRPTSTGIGYHRQGVEPWRVDDGELWSSAYGKVCPGAKKISQIPSTIRRAQVVAAGPTEPEEPDMQFSDAIPGLTDPDGSPVTVGEALMRGVHAYREGPIDGSATDKRLTIVEGRVDPNTDAHADYAYDAVTEGGVVDRRLDAVQQALADLATPDPDASTEARLQHVEGVLTKLKEALA